MKLKVDPKIFEKWPETVVGVVVAKSLKNRDEGESLKYLRSQEESAREELQTKSIDDLPGVTAWRGVYKGFGADPKRYLSSVEALLTRVKAGKLLPEINPLVNYYNALSLKYQIPFGGEDLDQVVGDIELVFASGVESGMYIGSEQEVKADKGEVIYKDALGFICRRWNYREADRTKLTADTKNTILVAELVSPNEKEKVEQALVEFSTVLREKLGGEISTFYLDKDHCEIEIPFVVLRQGVAGLPDKAEEGKGVGKTVTRAGGEKKAGRVALTGGIAARLRGMVFEVVRALGMDSSKEEIEISHPALEMHGDYTTNIAFKEFRKKMDKPENRLTDGHNVQSLAEGIVECLRKREDFGEIADRAEIAGGGFINIWLKNEYLINQLGQLLSGQTMTELAVIGKGKKALIEYASPNIAKSFGIGHLRSTIIGQAIYNLYKFLGYETIGDNHLGDWGTQFGKLLFMIEREGGGMPEELKSSLTLEKLEKMYVDFHIQAREDPQMEEEARKWFKRLEDGDPIARTRWEACVEVSLLEFNKIFEMLGVLIDHAYGESYYETLMKEVIEEAKKTGVAKESEGALIIEIPGMRTPLMLLKSDGGTTYATRDVATLLFRKRQFDPDVIVYEVGGEQALHFVQVFAAARMLGYVRDGVEIVHVAHGLYLGEDGKKLSTREGKSIKLLDVLEEAVERAAKLGNHDPQVAKQVGIGAIKYFDLKHVVQSDIVFSWEKMFELTGNSGPYIQYTYARAQSVLRKSKNRNSKLQIDQDQGRTDQTPNLNLNDEERAVLRYLYRFSEVIIEAAHRFAPNLLCEYLFELSGRFNTFYNRHSILGQGEGGETISAEVLEFRLALTRGVGEIIGEGLGILGITAVERM